MKASDDDLDRDRDLPKAAPEQGRGGSNGGAPADGRGVGRDDKRRDRDRGEALRGDLDDADERAGEGDFGDEPLVGDLAEADLLDDAAFGDAGANALSLDEHGSAAANANATEHESVLGEAGEAAFALDVGETDELAFGDESDRFDEREEAPLDDEDLGIDDEGASFTLDAGEEGPEREDDAIDDALPALDADHEGDAGDDAFVASFGLARIAGALAWDDRALERAASPEGARLREDQDGAAVVVTGADGAETCLARAAGPHAVTSALAEKGIGVALPESAPIVSRGDAVSFVRPTVGVFVADDGRTWRAIGGTESATAVVWTDESLLAALFDAKADRTWLVRIHEDGEARIVAEVPDEDADDGRGGRTTALLYDPAERLVWAAGDYGVLAFREAPRRKRRS
jgi:hypothetical protein